MNQPMKMNKDMRDQLFKDCPECKKETEVFAYSDSTITNQCKSCDTFWVITFKISER